MTISTEDLRKQTDSMVKDRADWLVDAVACATQNRIFLRGEDECDDVACDAIQMNGAKALRHVVDNHPELITARAKIEAAEKLADALRDFATAKIDALRYSPPYGASPEDEPDPVVESDYVWALQSDAKAALAAWESLK